MHDACCPLHSPQLNANNVTKPPGGLHSAVRAGGCATTAGFAARAGAEAAHALTFNPGHSRGADHCARDSNTWRIFARWSIP